MKTIIIACSFLICACHHVNKKDLEAERQKLVLSMEKNQKLINSSDSMIAISKKMDSLSMLTSNLIPYDQKYLQMADRHRQFLIKAKRENDSISHRIAQIDSLLK